MGSARNDKGERFCLLCEKREDWIQILARCTVTEYLRVSSFSSEFLNSRRNEISFLGLLTDEGQGRHVCRFLQKVRRFLMELHGDGGGVGREQDRKRERRKLKSQE